MVVSSEWVQSGRVYDKPGNNSAVENRDRFNHGELFSAHATVVRGKIQTGISFAGPAG